MRVVVLVSGSGTLLQALLDAAATDPAAPYEVVAVGADRAGTGGVDRARAAGVPTFVVPLAAYDERADWDAALAAAVAEHAPDLVVSAGFMKVLGPAALAGPPVLNAHPALLPSFPGAHAVRDALAHGVKVSGCTIHLVDAGVDTGPVVAQRAVEVLDDDDEATLHERIKVAERALLVEVLDRLARGGMVVEGRKVRLG
ncbi:phosphoribosylglycinamide formyltransferase [Vallicoccus soli]|uniref:Phosphoribosylglycinamide formyltransferase n=1 Tax=Vallicoccus soli TaxID=2339232 RepID=A0A3A3YY88_9ACTN|nr:phosphoribosylglycinamide formyltransferase [Vallicoccus soli]RJK95264.1 phosphoribosylglycinamide formyltransferase [Vallicoccus soli]